MRIVRPPRIPATSAIIVAFRASGKLLTLLFRLQNQGRGAFVNRIKRPRCASKGVKSMGRNRHFVSMACNMPKPAHRDQDDSALLDPLLITSASRDE